MTSLLYPGVFDRVKAVTLDSFIVVLMLFIASAIFSGIYDASNGARIAAMAFIIIGYDPLFTSLFGGTLGHMALGLRVKRANNESRNVIFPLAIVRYVVKIGLGWISLLTVGSNEKHMAIHDMFIGSIVTYHKTKTPAKRYFAHLDEEE